MHNENQLYLIAMKVVKARIYFLNFIGISGVSYVIILWAWTFGANRMHGEIHFGGVSSRNGPN